ncbi:hypothetical protein D3C72_1653070 [compost metagenome]
MAQRQPKPGARRVRTDQGQAVGRGGADAGPGADEVHAGQARQEVDGPLDHARQQRGINVGIGLSDLAGRADQQLPGGPGLHIECDGGAVALLGAGHIAKLDQLMADARRVAVGDGQMAFFGGERQVVAKAGGRHARRQHDGPGIAARAIGQHDALAVDLADVRGLERHARWRMCQ